MKKYEVLIVIHTVSLITAIFTVFSEITYMLLRHTASFRTRKLLRQTWSGWYTRQDTEQKWGLYAHPHWALSDRQFTSSFSSLCKQKHKQTHSHHSIKKILKIQRETAYNLNSHVSQKNHLLTPALAQMTLWLLHNRPAFFHYVSVCVHDVKVCVKLLVIG